MIRVSSFHDVGDKLLGGAIAIGNFDGVHRGHQALIRKAVYLKGEQRAGVLTFVPHPSEILQERSHFYLTSDDQRAELFDQLGVDVALMQAIDQSFLTMAAEDFVATILVKALNVNHVVVGDDFTFGRFAQGDVALLKKLGAIYGFTTHVVNEVNVLGQRCSSSAIRASLSLGELPTARAMLGRPYSIRDRVQHGQKIGAGLGFRTANIIPPEGFAVKNGIYATVTRVSAVDETVDFLSATSVGVRPTITDSGDVVVETHILDEECMLYGETIEIFFITWLRDEMKFSSLDELKRYIQKDCDDIRELFVKRRELFDVSS